ncbi:MAG: DUF952 domain-containing protein [Chloroflexaceae bacterium]|jgi:uncharacterized protein (DUF952 family)|nr:DUF952 domain-containing protein [Chloroflexaceae bacterium]
MIIHITSRAAWQQAQTEGSYRADSLTSEGFIHCSTPQQVVRVANTIYRGQPGLVLLCIDPARLTALLRYEPPVQTDDPLAAELFPHLYGPLNLDAVVQVLDFPAEEDGSFQLPADVATGVLA